jgi:hypothetical protein
MLPKSRDSWAVAQAFGACIAKLRDVLGCNHETVEVRRQAYKLDMSML